MDNITEVVKQCEEMQKRDERITVIIKNAMTKETSEIKLNPNFEFSVTNQRFFQNGDICIDYKSRIQRIQWLPNLKQMMIYVTEER